MSSPFNKIRAKIIEEYLDKFPDCPSLTLARILHRDVPKMGTVEQYRVAIRYRRGANGAASFDKLKNKKYAKYRV